MVMIIVLEEKILNVLLFLATRTLCPAPPCKCSVYGNSSAAKLYATPTSRIRNNLNLYTVHTIHYTLRVCKYIFSISDTWNEEKYNRWIEEQKMLACEAKGKRRKRLAMLSRVCECIREEKVLHLADMSSMAMCDVLGSLCSEALC